MLQRTPWNLEHYHYNEIILHAFYVNIFILKKVQYGQTVLCISQHFCSLIQLLLPKSKSALSALLPHKKGGTSFNVQLSNSSRNSISILT